METGLVKPLIAAWSIMETLSSMWACEAADGRKLWTCRVSSVPVYIETKMVLSPVATAQTHALCYALIDESLRT